MPNLDLCPTCARRITDYDMTGCETPSGQRWCMDHLPQEAYPDLYDEWHGHQATHRGTPNDS